MGQVQGGADADRALVPRGSLGAGHAPREDPPGATLSPSAIHAGSCGVCMQGSCRTAPLASRLGVCDGHCRKAATVQRCIAPQVDKTGWQTLPAWSMS